jgi:hypothetical protein
MKGMPDLILRDSEHFKRKLVQVRFLFYCTSKNSYQKGCFILRIQISCLSYFLHSFGFNTYYLPSVINRTFIRAMVHFTVQKLLLNSTNICTILQKPTGQSTGSITIPWMGLHTLPHVAFFPFLNSSFFQCLLQF